MFHAGHPEPFYGFPAGVQDGPGVWMVPEQGFVGDVAEHEDTARRHGRGEVGQSGALVGQVEQDHPGDGHAETALGDDVGRERLPGVVDHEPRSGVGRGSRGSGGNRSRVGVNAGQIRAGVAADDLMGVLALAAASGMTRS